MKDDKTPSAIWQRGFFVTDQAPEMTEQTKIHIFGLMFAMMVSRKKQEDTIYAGNQNGSTCEDLSRYYGCR